MTAPISPAASPRLLMEGSTIDELTRPLPPYAKSRWFLLILFCSAQFIDIYSGSGVTLAIPQISEQVHLTIPESIWVISAYALAFAAMMLPAGRVADIWSAKYTFVLGLVWIGSFSLGLGFVKDPNGLIVMRALQGVGAAMTIPAATNLIVALFPEPDLQEIAISLFSATAAIANVLGLVIGGLLLLADYKWIFYMITIVVWPGAILGFLFIPNTEREDFGGQLAQEAEGSTVKVARKAKMDYLGTLCMAGAMTLLIYGLTSANIDGWRSASALSTMIIGGLLFPVFLWVETLPEHEDDALIPPSFWKVHNSALLSLLSLAPFFWFFSVQSGLSERMQLFGATPLLVAARFLPMGVSAVIGVVLTQVIPLRIWPLRLRLMTGALLAAGGALLVSFGRETEVYWKLLFPGFILGPIGVSLILITLNVAIVMSVGPERAGVAGGVVNSLFQLGIAIGLSVTTALQNAYRLPSGTLEWKGYRYAYLFLMSVFLLVGILVAIFFRDPSTYIADDKEHPASDQQQTLSDDNGVHEKRVPGPPIGS